MPLVSLISSIFGCFFIMSATPFDTDLISFATTIIIISIIISLAVIFNANYTKKMAIISLIICAISLNTRNELNSTRNSSSSNLTTVPNTSSSTNSYTSDSSTTSLLSTTKEDRSTYVAKCTTIDYQSLARNPNLYKGNNYTFTGKVIQVVENYNNVTLRVNVTPKSYEYSGSTYYDDTVLVDYKYSDSYESRILEDDMITLYGKFMGTQSYQSVLGGYITIPYLSAMYIDIR